MTLEKCTALAGGLVLAEAAWLVGGWAAWLVAMAALVWGGYVMPRLVERERRR